MYLYLNSKIICKNIEVAETFYSRFKGLMFRKNMNDIDGLLLKKCKSIHMFFMKFPIDVIFVDKNFNIVKICENIKPWHITGYYYKAAHAIEFRAGFIKENNITQMSILEFKNKE